MSFQSSSTTMPSERWQPAAVAQLALIILIGTALLNLVERIIVAIKVPDTSEAQSDMQHEIAELKRQAKFLNNPDTFAQCAKMERKALALEKHLDRLQTQEKVARAQLLLKIPGYTRTLGIVAVFVLSYKVPVAVALRPEWLWPLGKWLAMGTGKPRVIGFVGIIPWTMICHRATKALFGVRS
ncbi:hypothetical protein Ndes2526B_g00609 [Nannochloris sp. 'desiccata']|nr:hypothetical protein KSW81_003907 [Chlorella desiccata (nom. nud.)]KAH7624412.1 putative Guided entry of tail-anchored proteins factor 1 [Chlorella desiccata (nom. nud.)]